MSIIGSEDRISHWSTDLSSPLHSEFVRRWFGELGADAGYQPGKITSPIMRFCEKCSKVWENYRHSCRERGSVINTNYYEDFPTIGIIRESCPQCTRPNSLSEPSGRELLGGWNEIRTKTSNTFWHVCKQVWRLGEIPSILPRQWICESCKGWCFLFHSSAYN